MVALALVIIGLQKASATSGAKSSPERSSGWLSRTVSGISAFIFRTVGHASRRIAATLFPGSAVLRH